MPGIKPSKTLRESLGVFTGWDDAKVHETLCQASAKVSNLRKFAVTKDEEQVGAIMAYTDETELYAELNLSMRKKGGMHEKKLVVYGMRRVWYPHQ